MSLCACRHMLMGPNRSKMKSSGLSCLLVGSAQKRKPSSLRTTPHTDLARAYTRVRTLRGVSLVFGAMSSIRASMIVARNASSFLSAINLIPFICDALLTPSTISR